MWNAPAVWKGLNKAWTTLKAVDKKLQTAIQAENQAREVLVLAFLGLAKAESRESTAFKAVRKLSSLYFSRDTRAACKRVNEASEVLERAKRNRFGVEQERNQALKDYTKEQEVWALVCASAEYDSRMRRMLGVSSTASPAEIKSAYRDAVKRCHPDRAQVNNMSTEHAAELFREVQEAFEFLDTPDEEGSG
jgi:DnaJ-domain-containing protein 1